MAGWVRVETRFPSHPKVLDVGPLGEALWLRGLCYAGEHLTDGFVPTSYLKRMGDMKALAVAERLVAAGLWSACEGGYLIHEYLQWQQSREEIEDIRSKRVEAGRRGGKQKASNLLAKGQQAAGKNVPEEEIDTETERETGEREGADAPAANAAPPPPPKPRPVPKPHKTTVPQPFPVTDEMLAFGRKIGLSHDHVMAETDKFVDHFTFKGEKHVDWLAAWRNWMRRAVDFAARDGPRNGNAPQTKAERKLAMILGGSGQ